MSFKKLITCSHFSSKTLPWTDIGHFTSWIYGHLCYGDVDWRFLWKHFVIYNRDSVLVGSCCCNSSNNNKHRLCCLHNKHLFCTFLEGTEPKIKALTNWVRANFLVHKQPSSDYVLAWWKESERALWGFNLFSFI